MKHGMYQFGESNEPNHGDFDNAPFALCLLAIRSQRARKRIAAAARERISQALDNVSWGIRMLVGVSCCNAPRWDLCRAVFELSKNGGTDKHVFRFTLAESKKRNSSHLRKPTR